MSSSKKWTNKGTLWQVFICLRPPPLLAFCLRWSINFVDSECGQIQNVLNSCRIWSPTRLNTPSQPHIVWIYCTLTQGRRGRWTRKTVREATVHKAGSKIPTCRIPIRHFFSQSRRLLTKIFESVETVNEKFRCLWIRGQGAIKRGCYARYLPFPSFIKPGTRQTGLTGRF